MQDRWITDWTPSERWPHYTRANAGEVLPTPTSPLGQTFTWDNGITLGWRDGYVRTGSYERHEFTDERPAVCGSFGGYFYINLSNVRMQAVRNPALTVEQLDMAFFGDHPDVPPYVPHPDDEQPQLTERIGAHLGWVMSLHEWPEILQDKADVAALRAGRPDLTTSTGAQLVARARSMQPMLRHLFDQHAITSSASGIAPGILFAVGQAIGDATVPMKLLAGVGDVDSAEPSYALWDLSRQVRASAELTSMFDAGLPGLLARIEEAATAGSDEVQAFLAYGRAFLVEFGSRGPNEWEMIADTWETKPEIALAALDRIRLQRDEESPRARNAARAAERAEVTASTRAKVAAMGEAGAELAGMLEGALVAGNMMAYRERTKTNIVKVVHECRMVFREIGRRAYEAGHLADPAHVFMLLDSEVEAFIADPSSFTATLAQRSEDWKALFDLEPPFIIKDGNVPPLGTWTRRGASTAVKAKVGDVLQGVPGCPGVVRARARVILDPADPSALEPGDVMVAPLTDPAWTPLFMAAGGVVVNVGGQISHAIIVSRELGLPCVVSVTGATDVIPDGAMVEVDGSTGQVTIIDVPDRS